MCDYYLTSYSSDLDFSLFKSGDNELDEYIKTKAFKDVSDGMCNCLVIKSLSNNDICGYLTLTPRSIGQKKLTTLIDKVDYPSVPFVLIGRFALDRKYRGNKISDLIFSCILRKLVEISDVIKFVGVDVEAKNADLIKKVYEPLGFRRITEKSNHLVYLLDYQDLKEYL